MRNLICILFFLLISKLLLSQDTLTSTDPNFTYFIVLEGDTVYLSSISPVYITPVISVESKRDMRRYRKLIRNIKVVYPYAKIAARKYEEVVVEYAKLTSEREKKEYMKKVEEELKSEFEGELKNLTISQGRILIKLIDREIGLTSYDIVKEYRGNFSAFFWQALAKLFGNNLKSTFDADGEDKIINDIILLIDNGQL